jgi:uncharacterized membrane protein
MSEDDAEADSRESDRSVGGQIAGDLSLFISLAGDYYRGEIDRATTWRARLDQTTNWAVVIVAAVLTWAFSGDSRPHYVILIGVFGVTAFLLMEANRYREYDAWRDRVRKVQTNLIAEMFSPGGAPDNDWQDQLGTELREPAFEISFRGALHHRLRRSYLALLSILLLAWVARITVYQPQEPWYQSASILGIPGEAVTGFVGVFFLTLVVLTLWSAREDRTREFQV